VCGCGGGRRCGGGVGVVVDVRVVGFGGGGVRMVVGGAGVREVFGLVDERELGVMVQRLYGTVVVVVVVVAVFVVVVVLVLVVGDGGAAGVVVGPS